MDGANGGGVIYFGQISMGAVAVGPDGDGAAKSVRGHFEAKELIEKGVVS